MVGVRKYQPYTHLVKTKIAEQFPNLKDHKYGKYFAEIQDTLILDSDNLKYEDPVLREVNQEFLALNQEAS